MRGIRHSACLGLYRFGEPAMQKIERSRMRIVHFVLFLPDRTTAIYKRTADRSHAVLAVANVPPGISDRAVEIAVNLTAIARPFRQRCTVDYAQLGAGRVVNLYR